MIYLLYIYIILSYNDLKACFLEYHTSHPSAIWVTQADHPPSTPLFTCTLQPNLPRSFSLSSFLRRVRSGTQGS